jgi:hypothetical protein
MADLSGNILALQTDELGRATEILAMADGDVIPQSMGGTGGVALSATTGLVYDSAAGTLTTADDVETVTFVGGSEKLIARKVYVSTELSSHGDCVARLDGTVSANQGISASGPWGFSSVDAGKLFYLRRQDGATYENLIRADDGTITLQAEDDIHLKSNTGEDFARFNENAAVWLYYDNSKKIETHNLGAVVTGSVSATTGIEASGMPYPPPFSWLGAGADLGTGVDNFYFGSGVSVTENNPGIAGITFDATNGYWNITDAGWYEVHGAIGMNVTASPAEIKNYVITTTGYGGTESIKSYTTTNIRTNMDPHHTAVDWIGYLTAGVKLAIKCDVNTGTITSERGSSASVRRIA